MSALRTVTSVCRSIVSRKTGPPAEVTRCPDSSSSTQSGSWFESGSPGDSAGSMRSFREHSSMMFQCCPSRSRSRHVHKDFAGHERCVPHFVSVRSVAADARDAVCPVASAQRAQRHAVERCRVVGHRLALGTGGPHRATRAAVVGPVSLASVSGCRPQWRCRALSSSDPQLVTRTSAAQASNGQRTVRVDVRITFRGREWDIGYRLSCLWSP